MTARAAVLAALLMSCSSSRGAESGDAAKDAPVDSYFDAHADSSNADAKAPDAPASDAPSSCTLPAQPDVLTFTLTHAAYPGSGHPDVAVHIPPGFDPCNRPSLVVFFHGWYNCVTTVIGSVDAPCTPGGPARSALDLAEQVDAAKVNAVLVAVELAFDQPTGAPGALDQPGEFKAMLDELLSEHLAELGVPPSVAGFDRLVLASHSGGYVATASALDVGGAEVSEVELFDSLYGQYPTYQSFIENNLSRFDPNAAAPLRFSDVYTANGGTLALSEQLEADVEAALAQAGLSASLFADFDTAPTPTAADYAKPVFFKHSALSHDGVPRFYFAPLLTASTIAKIP